jgi:hypothetical protein
MPNPTEREERVMTEEEWLERDVQRMRINELFAENERSGRLIKDLRLYRPKPYNLNFALSNLDKLLSRLKVEVIGLSLPSYLTR